MNNAERLDLYLTLLARDPDAPPPPGMDAATVEFARLLARAEAAPPGALRELPAARARVWSRVQAAARPSRLAVDGRAAGPSPASTASTDTRGENTMLKTVSLSPGLTPAHPAPRRGYFSLTLAVALLAVILLGGVLLVNRPPSDGSIGGAALQAATPTPLAPTATPIPPAGAPTPIALGETVSATLENTPLDAQYIFTAPETGRYIVHASAEGFRFRLEAAFEPVTGGQRLGGGGGGGADSAGTVHGQSIDLHLDSGARATFRLISDGPVSGTYTLVITRVIQLTPTVAPAPVFPPFVLAFPSCQVIVSADEGAAVRANPAPDGQIVATAPAGQALSVNGRQETDGGAWYRIRFAIGDARVEGWVSAADVAANESAPCPAGDFGPFDYGEALDGLLRDLNLDRLPGLSELSISIDELPDLKQLEEWLIERLPQVTAQFTAPSIPAVCELTVSAEEGARVYPLPLLDNEDLRLDVVRPGTRLEAVLLIHVGGEQVWYAVSYEQDGQAGYGWVAAEDVRQEGTCPAPLDLRGILNAPVYPGTAVTSGVDVVEVLLTPTIAPPAVEAGGEAQAPLPPTVLPPAAMPGGDMFATLVLTSTPVMAPIQPALTITGVLTATIAPPAVEAGGEAQAPLAPTVLPPAVMPGGDMFATLVPTSTPVLLLPQPGISGEILLTISGVLTPENATQTYSFMARAGDVLRATVSADRPVTLSMDVQAVTGGTGVGGGGGGVDDTPGQPFVMTVEQAVIKDSRVTVTLNAAQDTGGPISFSLTITR